LSGLHGQPKEADLVVEDFSKVALGRLARKSTFWPAFLALPRDRRADLKILYGALAYADSLVDDAPSAEAAPRLEAFRKALAWGYEQPTAPAGLEALIDCCRRRSIPWELWEAFFEGLAQDTRVTRYPTFQALKDYCYRVASVVGLMSLKVFGYDSPQAQAYAVALGQALQLTNIIRDIPKDALRGRLYIPQEDLERFGVSEEELLQGRPSRAALSLLAFQADRAKKAFAEARRLKPRDSTGALLPAEIMGSLYERLLRKIEEKGFDVWKDTVALGRVEKLWAILRGWLTGCLRR
jgi:phytoene synthase